MGKKKRGHPDIEEILARPWCYYCERDFDDLKILINHQKARHFKCERCGRRLNTAGGLSVHMTQVHKETLTTIENSLPNRSGLDVEIFGMEGIPEDIVTSHNQRVLGQFAQAEAERRAATGNPGPGGAGASGAKKAKFEAPSDLKKRLAEHKAKKAAEQLAGISSGDATPVGGQRSQSPGLGQSPGKFQAGSPGFAPPQMQFGGPPGNSTYSSYPQPYAQQGAVYQQQPSPYPQQQQPFSQQQQPFPQQQPPHFAQQQPSPFSPPQSSPFGPPQQSPYPPPQNAFAPPAMPQFTNNQQFAPPQQFHPPNGQGFQPQFQTGPPQFQNGPSQPYQSDALPVLFQQGQFQPPRNHTPPQNGLPPQRPATLPPAPGLPQRPSFGAPPVNAFQMQQMHQGQLAGPPNPPDNQPFIQQQQRQSGPNGTDPRNDLSTDATSLDDLLSGAAKYADRADSALVIKPDAKADEPQEEKKGKKDKEKNMKLVYSDNEISPEEKMAQLPRYAFIPSGKEYNELGEATTSAVTDVASG